MKPLYNSRADIDAASEETRNTLLKMLWSVTINAAGVRNDSPMGYTWRELGVLMGGTPPVPVPPASPEPDPVPEAITRRQALLLIINQGKFDQVEAAVNGANSPALRVEYDNQIWRRDNSVLRAMAQQVLGMNDAAINAFFMAASKL